MNSHKDYTANIAARVSGKDSVFFWLFFLISCFRRWISQGAEVDKFPPWKQLAARTGKCQVAAARHPLHDSDTKALRFPEEKSDRWSHKSLSGALGQILSIFDDITNSCHLSGWLSFIKVALNACFKLIKLVLIVTNCNCTCVHFHERTVVFELLSAIPRPIMNLIEIWTRIHTNIARNTNTNNKRNIVTQSWPWASPRPIIDQIAPSYHPPILVTPC